MRNEDIDRLLSDLDYFTTQERKALKNIEIEKEKFKIYQLLSNIGKRSHV